MYLDAPKKCMRVTRQRSQLGGECMAVKTKKCGGKAAQACAMRGHLELGRLLLESQRAVARLHNLGLDDLHDHAFQLVTDARTAESLKH